MPTVKLVVIGASGVGKTSLRTQYISGRFSTGYRATIGADFISKTLPHPTKPDQSVTLQIWDTAGQERFSSLSAAFFRGADAALLMFDVNKPETLTALTRWWSQFREKAPLSDDELEDYCCVVVGNKIDVVDPYARVPPVSESEALQFINELVPPSTPPPSPPCEIAIPHVQELSMFPSITMSHNNGDIDLPLLTPRTRSIDISHHYKRLSKSRSRSSNQLNNGTMTSTHTGFTTFHTPSSSLFDAYESARSSPIPSSARSSRPTSPTRTPRRIPSVSSTSSSAVTITPSLFNRGQAVSMAHLPVSRPERRPRLFLTSAKTGEGVGNVFEYIARRVVLRWEYEETIEARTLLFRSPNDTDAETVRLGLSQDSKRSAGISSCCGR
ncbi:hypothetical protein SERLADRAFT_471213 [Serpula lacrymans var. lacrymans S7.9]|uniref:Ras-domain-containing protein n=2 Tax=Serpula lacrymans var. lacrymans TaxID=341189 RepID=F8P0V7_SERL9|nr:uncharacterized protein SERLADRAFT_471213 [Serpula lacrymans var. lacrymans S7.9]EGO22791.1 hypothetical protein SERLADRAFT_471213 [Serpula lacrymans var. lacrymans S7.9]